MKRNWHSQPADKALSEYRTLIRQGFAFAAADDTTEADAQRWVRAEGVSRALIGRAVADGLVEQEAEALRQRGACPFCGGSAGHGGSDSDGIGTSRGAAGPNTGLEASGRPFCHSPDPGGLESLPGASEPIPE